MTGSAPTRETDAHEDSTSTSLEGGSRLSIRWVYIGELGEDGKLDWGGPPGGNIPDAGLVPDLHDTGFYLMIRQLAREGKYEGRNPDFDASALKVDGPQLRELIALHYGRDALVNPGNILKPYVQLADSLGDRCVALMAVAM